MRTTIPWTVLSLFALAGCDTPPSAGPAGDKTALEVPGHTQCVPGRSATIAPVVLHPVEEVKVAPGDRVKKGQILVRIDDDEPKADLRNKEALLDSVRVTANANRLYAQRLEAIHVAVAEQRLYDARAVATKAEHDEKAAQAAVDSAKAELEHYTVTAPIDGVVSWLKVNVGTVSRPGTSVWGEILDLSEIDVRCDLTPEQADRVTVGQPAEVRANGHSERWAGKVVSVGIAADAATGTVPVVVRVADAKERLRCRVPVTVRFQ
jgi:RND family efflux transporter MFP subunit